nr:hypothetical protein [Tanacetum cinerariifolium]
MPPRQNNRRNETPKVDPAFIAPVQQVVRALLPELMDEITTGMNKANNANNSNNANRRNGRRYGNGKGGNGRDAQAVDIYVWLEWFQKQKHARLATYKLEGDAHSWWRAYKQAKGSDGYVETLSWNNFRAIFFLQYFPRSEQEKYERESKSIRQRDAHDKLVNTEFSHVAEAANTTRNIEILQKEMLALTPNENKKRTQEDGQDESEARSGKQKDNHRNEWLQNTQHGHGRDRYPRCSNAAYFDSAPITKCNTCGKCHPSNTCYKATEACYNCEQIGHKAIGCKGKDGTDSKGNDGNNSPKTTTGGRVFAKGEYLCSTETPKRLPFPFGNAVGTDTPSKRFLAVS